MKQAWMLPPIILFCILTICVVEMTTKQEIECHNWQKDMISCKEKECCTKLRSEQPRICFIPENACSIYDQINFIR